ncbi:gluconate 2-dehydrogenase subunit 3 family protein [Alteromonas sediminis]|uniref:Gluconate 2-dehydrogenase subunit 3 family protein n=1 Tax=Alteromonas sediminis TaxID=2259342 RepID=A0A3N5Y0W2_9ALTE|nr:gluconate 2-dehydrogenase subunit 3 family protein [Alteromonas sediminis]RPJ66780.1 gluconate 2-dehydrogenase subunit 3 family protein [Alteromonas sediminis]
MNNQKALSRRELLRHCKDAAIAATAVSWLSTQHIASAFAYTPKQGGEVTGKGKLLSFSQLKALQAIAQTILPATDTPGAGDLDCHGFVDHQLFTCHTEDQQGAVKEILTEIQRISVNQGSSSFELLNEQQRYDLLSGIEAKQGYSDTQRSQFKFLKELVVFGYFTSQVGATQALNYQAVPGGYKGSIPADENTKSWGSLMSY